MLNVSLKVQEALEEVNTLVTTGYIGGRDQLKKYLKRIEANIHFGIFFYIIISINTLKDTFLKVLICCSIDSVNMKPGKSTTYITCMLNGKQKHILYLPGNSATVLITAHLFLLPLLNKMHHNDLETPVIRAHVRLSLV